MANLGYIQVTRLCNQHCLFCSNPEIQKNLAIEDARRQIEKLVAARYEGIILTGGEPTLHPDLIEIITIGKNSGIHVRLITNGQRTADPRVLEALVQAGLDHLHISVHSSHPDVQAYLTGNHDSWSNIERTLDGVGRLGITCDINTVICAQNADHLDQTVKEVTTRFPFVRHFVWNNIDSKMNRVDENPHTVARLADLELSLHRALQFLEASGRTFRVERLPLCYMVEFAHASTETRKIVKKEERTVHFLDEKGEIRQTEFFHEKTLTCKSCSIERICAGLYDLGGRYNPMELHAVFVDPQQIIDKILAG